MCEAHHLNLKTPKEVRYYFSLVKKWQYYDELWRKRRSNRARTQLEAAQNKLKKYVEKHNIKEDIFYNIIYADSKYKPIIQELIIEGNEK